METEKWESGERPNDHVLGERWPPGAAEMSQATVSRAVADETQCRSLRAAHKPPESGRWFRFSPMAETGPIAACQVSGALLCKADI